MSNKKTRLSVVVVVLAFALVAAVPGFAGTAIVGSVAASTNATVSGQPALQGSVVFSGDILKVTKDGVAMVTYGRGSRALFGRDSDVSFSREGESLTARLASGSVSIFQPGDERNGLQLKFDNVTIGPAGGYKTLGDVAMLGDQVVVRTKEGMMNVHFADGKTTQVPAGKVMRLVPNSQRAPQEAMGSQHFTSQTDWVPYATLAAGGLAAILAAVDISKTDNATSAANSAGAAANSATAAANSATAAANAAASEAAAAQSQAAAATVNTNAVGCALDKQINGGSTSPYMPPSGSTCPGT